MQPQGTVAAQREQYMNYILALLHVTA